MLFPSFQNLEIHELNAYIASLYEKNQSNMATFNKKFEKFKQNAAIQLYQCTRRSGFDIDMCRTTARPFFQLQKLNIGETVEGSSCARYNATGESVADHPLEEKEKYPVTKVPVDGTSTDAKSDLTNHEEPKHNQNTVCSSNRLKDNCKGKSSDLSNCIVDWSKTKMNQTELLKHSDPAFENNDKPKREILIRSNNNISCPSSSKVRGMNYCSSKVELHASQFYSLHLKRNAESQASIMKLNRLLNNDNKVFCQTSNLNSYAVRNSASTLNCKVTSNLHKRSRQHESEASTALFQKKRVKWSL